MAEKKNLKGIEGWLLFYLIVLIIGVINNIIGLFVVNRLSSLGGDASVILPQTAGLACLEISGILLGIGIIIFIISQHKDAPKWIIGFVWGGFALSLIETLFVIIPFQKASASTIGAASSSIASIGAYTGLFFGVVVDVIITLYFIKSKRVKNTFVKK